MKEPAVRETAHWLVEAWRNSLRRSLEALAGPDAAAAIRFRSAAARQADWPAWVAPAWYRLALEAVPGAAVIAGGSRPALQALGRLLAGDPGLADADCREAFRELLNRAAALAAGSISERLGRRVPFSPATDCSPPAASDGAMEIILPGGREEAVLALVLNPELMDAVGEEERPAEVTVLPPVRDSGSSTNLDLLMEVELPLCVTFGRTQLPLKDVLKLSSGSIVELNRLVNEPVEVLINNSVIARGEVVVVDGNYGIRVTEIVSRQERIRSIF